MGNGDGRGSGSRLSKVPGDRIGALGTTIAFCVMIMGLLLVLVFVVFFF